jgi:hypothetical protein
MNLVAKSYVPDLLLKLLNDHNDIEATYSDQPNTYKVLGISKPAGVLKGTPILIVYQSSLGEIYHRDIDDFCCKMNLAI